jgi:hypothetical protein
MEGPPVCKLSQANCQIERRFVGVVVAIGLMIDAILIRANYNIKRKRNRNLTLQAERWTVLILDIAIFMFKLVDRDV